MSEPAVRPDVDAVLASLKDFSAAPPITRSLASTRTLSLHGGFSSPTRSDSARP